MEMSWKYLTANITLKFPFVDESSRKVALSQLQKELKKITPAFVHEVNGVTEVPVEKLSNNNNCVNVNDKRDCGCG